MGALSPLIICFVAGLALSGCSSFLPERPIAIGCELQQGNGPRDQGVDPPGIPLPDIAGLTPIQADAAVTAAGHVAVFRLDDMTCVCVPPAGYGPVAEGWWASNGVLWLDLEGVVPQGNKLVNNTGC